MLPILVTGIRFVDIQSPLSFYLFICTLLIVFLNYRENVENDRRQILIKSEERLQKLFMEKASLAEALEEKVAERTAELKASNQQLLAMSELKDEFVSNVSHELRTPITTIGLYLDLIKHKPENQASYLRILDREKERFTYLIENLLFLSRIDQEQEELSLEKMDLNNLIETFVNDRKVLVEEKNIHLDFEPLADIHLVTADRRLIEQVLGVLLTNAINYTPDGGRIIFGTTMSKELENPWTGFFISDSGPGLTAEDKQQLFNRFYRGNAAELMEVNGTGLGLAIAKEILNLQNGDIQFLENSHTSGATFLVTLPIV